MKIHPKVLDVPIISTACTIHSLGDLLGENVGSVFCLLGKQKVYEGKCGL